MHYGLIFSQNIDDTPVEEQRAELGKMITVVLHETVINATMDIGTPEHVAKSSSFLAKADYRYNPNRIVSFEDVGLFYFVFGLLAEPYEETLACVLIRGDETYRNFIFEHICLKLGSSRYDSTFLDNGDRLVVCTPSRRWRELTEKKIHDAVTPKLSIVN